VYCHKGSFYVFHDAGLEGPYSTKHEAVEVNQVATINGATQVIWDKDTGSFLSVWITPALRSSAVK